MRHRIRNNLKSEKGSAMLMALSVILILTAFGTVSLMTSVANVKMSSTYRNWSEDYYTLDKNAEDRVNQLNVTLQTAESDAQKYMDNQDYLYDPTDQTATPPSDFQGDLQGTIFAETQSVAQIYINTHWQTDTDIFNRLYYYYAATLLNGGQFTSLDHQEKYSVTYQDNPIIYDSYQRGLFGGASLTGNLAVIIDTNDPSDPADPIQIEPDTVKGKEVSVKVNILPPTYNQVLKKVALIGNPIWANAITAAGSIDFTGTVTSTVYGDIFSADKDEPLIFDDTQASKGVSSSAYDVEINGNVYSKGNLHITGDNSTLNVNKYDPTFETTLKNNIFSNNILNNNLFFDTAAAKCPANVDIANFTEGTVPADPDPNTGTDMTDVPLVYKDSSGGNAYCNSLAVEGFSAGKLNVAGNVITYNDIRMNGLSSEITVAGNNIGVNSTALTTADPNANSSVINNTALPQSTESTITLEGKFIVPGTAWAEYTGDKYNGDSSYDWTSNRRYYETAESISAKNADIFSAYMTPPPLSDQYNYVFDQYTTYAPPPIPPQTIDETTVSSFYLMRGINKGDPVNESGIADADKPNILDAKKLRLDNYLDNFLTTKNLVTNIKTGPSPTIEGYSLGAVLIHQGNAPSATVYDGQTAIAHYASNYNSYTSFESSLANIFVAKTQQLGANTIKPVTEANLFTGFIDKNVIVDNNGNVRSGISSAPSDNLNSFAYIKQTADNQSLDLDGEKGIIYYDGNLNITGDGAFNGIIYCAGNLNIEGNVTFKGAIICEGDVVVSGNPTITYDEATIISVLKGDLNARLFFAPGAMGMATTQTASSDGAVRTDVRRYQIAEWKELQN